MNTAQWKALRTKERKQPALFLQELLAFFSDKPGIMVAFEMKTDPTLYPEARLTEYCRKLHDIVTTNCPKESLYLFSSADRRAHRHFQQHYPQSERQLLTGKPCSNAFVQEAKALGLRRLGCRIDQSTREAVRKAQQAGMTITGGDANSWEDYLLGQALRVDNMVSDTPVAIQNKRAQ